MFDRSKSSYDNIVSEIGIVGYLEEDIINLVSKKEEKIPLNLLYSLPKKESV